MSKALEKLQNCMRCIREKTDFQPEVALILGSGLGDYAESIDIRAEVSYHDIEGFPVSTVPGHKGRFVFGYVNRFRWSSCRAASIIMRATPWRTWCFQPG